ncbi:hypothetical protein MMC30_006627 [Trapelia coarctata]|nr:hypothetical protein [Trapelia coarctata]
MESIVPPSYEEATTRDYWAVIAHYIQSPDLCSASLVSKRWHTIFAPCLWGNPASHFGTENDRVYVALTRFKRALPRVRLSVRQLTHTLHLPPALSEIYDGPHPEWLRDVLEQLPNLQSLIVSQLPFFDHSAFFALKQSSTERKSSDDFPTFPLRLLIATKCGNTTSAGLAEAFLHWPSLVFLDLSDTIPARDHAVLSSFRFMTGLQILKLRHIQLRDEDIDILADAIGIRVRSLDIRDNRVTDATVRTLLTKCFHTIRDVHAIQNGTSRVAMGMAEEDWPAGVPRPNSPLLNEFRGEDLDERFFQRLTKGVVNRLPSEDLPSSGLTHLYIANNFITVEGVASLLKTQNLYVLDAGTVDTVKALGGPRTRTSISQPFGRSISLPGTEKLTPVFERYAFKNLTYLRLHYAVVTEIAVVKDDMLSPLELAANEVARPELDAVDSSRFEMDATVPIYELAAGTDTPRFELAGDSVHVLVSPAIGTAPTPTLEEANIDNVRRGSIFAPEVVAGQSLLPGEPSTDDGEEDEPVVLTATGLGSMAQAMNGISGPSDEGGVLHSQQTTGNGMTQLNGNTEHSIGLIKAEREDLRSHNPEKPQGLSPGALPALRTLVLTDVPCTDKNGHVVVALKKFITDCAKEHELASLQAILEHPVIYVPGKPRSAHHLHRVRELFALRRLVLEMASQTPTGTSNTDGRPTTPRTPTLQGWQHTRNRSTTEDPDTEAFWNAQENDFSFFGEEECGLPATEPGMHFPRSTLSEKMVLPMSSLDPGGLPTLQQLAEADKSVDVVQELSKFRREKKALCEQAMKIGKKFVDGHWPGEVKVIRNHGGTARGKVDWYGNYFEKGYIYR